MNTFVDNLRNEVVRHKLKDTTLEGDLSSLNKVYQPFEKQVAKTADFW